LIPQSFIQDLLTRVDIVDVVGRQVKLRKGGANWMGLCPFHGEKSPSFTVSPTKQFYHCFGCGVHGTAIDFLMSYSGYGFVDAVRELSQELGLSVPSEAGVRDPAAEASRARAPDLIETLQKAAKFYSARLRDAPQAITYLKNRGVSGATAARFRLGYAPGGWRALEGAFADYGDDCLVEGGLVIASDAAAEGQPARRYDRFRDRVMFPIRNPRGQVIGFGGRVLGQGEPKYLNSPETPLFSKGRSLYGLYEARDAIRQHNAVVVVEGYMDVVMLAQNGVENAVATLGTATPADHVRLLARLVDRITFSFDGDKAGRKAAWRALEASLTHATDTRRIDFLFLPPEHDPDSFVRAHGHEGWRAALAEATPLSEFVLRELSSRGDLQTSEGRAQLQSQAREVLMALPDAALRQQLLARIAALVGLDVDALRSFYGIGAATVSREPRVPRVVMARRPPTVRAAERAFALAARHPALVHELPVDPTRGAPVAELGVAWVPPGRLAQGDEMAVDELPREVLDWIERLRTLPAGASFASVQTLLAQDSAALAVLQADELKPWAGLTLEEARGEFHRALAEVVLARLQDELAQIAASDPTRSGALDRYQALQRRMLALKSAYGRVRR